MARRGGEELSLSVAEYLQRRNTEAEFEELPVNRRWDITLRVEKGTRPDIPRSVLADFVGHAVAWHNRKRILNRYAGVQSRREKFIKSMVALYPGLRGIVGRPEQPRDDYEPAEDQEGTWRVDVAGQTKIKWNRAGLKEALGLSYPAAVTDRVTAEMTIPAGYQTETGELTPERAELAFRLGLAALGMPREDIEKILSTSVTPVVNEATLYAMMQAGTVRDIEQTGTATQTLAISDRLIQDLQDGAAADPQPVAETVPLQP